MAELEAHQVTGRKSNNALHSTSTRACLPCERGFFVGAFCLFESFLDCIVDVNELDVLLPKFRAEIRIAVRLC